jgi:hypothetical protein
MTRSAGDPLCSQSMREEYQQIIIFPACVARISHHDDEPSLDL